MDDRLQKYCTMSDTLCLFYHGPFGQWTYSPFTVGGIEYNCAEQYMMAQKAILFKDFTSFAEIMGVTGAFTEQSAWNQYPREQQVLGRSVRGFDAEVWDANAKMLVVRGNRAKFSQHADFLEMLLATGDRDLVEASPVDKVWGIGRKRTDPLALDKTRWLGKNYLGEALTLVRDELALKAKVRPPVGHASWLAYAMTTMDVRSAQLEGMFDETTETKSYVEMRQALQDEWDTRLGRVNFNRVVQRGTPCAPKL